MTKRQDQKEEGRAPRGHFVVYVGEEMKRFVVPLGYLNEPIFRQLLDQAAEEFGFNSQKCGLVMPCDESTFQGVLNFAAAAAS